MSIELKQFIERIERLEEEKRAITKDITEIYSEAKSAGFDPKVMRQVIKIRKMKEEEAREMEELVDKYLSAIYSAAA